MRWILLLMVKCFVCFFNTRKNKQFLAKTWEISDEKFSKFLAVNPWKKISKNFSSAQKAGSKKTPPGVVDGFKAGRWTVYRSMCSNLL